MLNILESSPIAHFVIGLDHTVISWNRACEMLTKVPAAEMIGTSRHWQPFYSSQRPVLADLIINNDYRGFLRLYENKNPARSKIVPHAWEATSFFSQLGGKSRHIYILAAPILDEQGKVTGALETIQDVTEQKQWLLETKQESEKIRRENIQLKSATNKRQRLGNIMGQCPSMQHIYEHILKAAASKNHVIISGESGTGKELAAKAIHDHSDRGNREFVPVNCSAIPENLLESEFFGYTKGAFTGACTDKHGYLDLADGGTLFLDEIGDISPNMQVKLLRALEGGGYTPVGSNRSKEADVRIVAATNKNLLEQVAKGLMREDFFYRIHVIPLHLPPLRERQEDILLLADHFLKKHDTEQKKGTLPTRLQEQLKGYDWPGNIRELENFIRRYLTLEATDFLTPSTPVNGEHLHNGAGRIEAEAARSLRAEVENFEKDLITRTLEKNHWHRSKVAALLGISRNTLFRKMKNFDLL